MVISPSTQILELDYLTKNAWIAFIVILGGFYLLRFLGFALEKSNKVVNKFFGRLAHYYPYALSGYFIATLYNNVKTGKVLSLDVLITPLPLTLLFAFLSWWDTIEKSRTEKSSDATRIEISGAKAVFSSRNRRISLNLF